MSKSKAAGSTSLSAALGVRGANEGKEDSEGWMESAAEVFLLSASEYIKSQQFDKAIEEIKQGREAATEQELPEIQ